MGTQLFIVYLLTYIGLFFSVYFLFTFFSGASRLTNPIAKKIYSATIAVPAYNEEETITKTIRSLLKLNYPKGKLDIIVVDDGSSDHTFEIASKFSKIRVFRKENGGKGSALNFALRKAKGELFAALDADSVTSPDALLKMVGYFDDPEVYAVTPSLKVAPPKTFLQRIQYVEYLFGIFLRKVFSFLDAIHVTPGPLTLYRKDFLIKTGGFDEHNLTEDIEIALRIQSKNKRIENAIDAEVFTTTPERFKPLFFQRLRWYTGFMNNVFRYKHLFHPRYKLLGVFILPSAFLSVSIVMFFVFFFLIRFFLKGFQAILNYSAVGFDFPTLFDQFRIDFFYLYFGPALFLALLSLALFVIFVSLASIYSRDKQRHFYFYPLYLLLYSFLFAFW